MTQKNSSQTENKLISCWSSHTDDMLQDVKLARKWVADIKFPAAVRAVPSKTAFILRTAIILHAYI